MGWNIRNSETEEIARIVFEPTGETKTQAVKVALNECLNQIQRQRSSDFKFQELLDIARHCSLLPVLDDRSADELIGYKKRTTELMV